MGYEKYIEFVERLNKFVFIKGNLVKMILFFIGVEVVENVVKIVCVVIGCSNVVVFSGGFYGCIVMIMVFIGKVNFYKVEFGLMFVGVFYVFFFIVRYGVFVE